MLGNDSTLLNRLSDSSVNHLISVLNSSTTITPKALYETIDSSTVNLNAYCDTLKTKKVFTMEHLTCQIHELQRGVIHI